MAGKIVIDTERCKGCGLCVIVCPKNAIVISGKSNKNGFFPAQPVPSVVEGAKNSDCTGCCLCALICPEVAIEVSRDDNTVVIKLDKKGKSTLVKEKA